MGGFLYYMFAYHLPSNFFLFSESIFVKCVSLRVAAASILWERMLMLNAMHIGD